MKQLQVVVSVCELAPKERECSWRGMNVLTLRMLAFSRLPDLHILRRTSVYLYAQSPKGMKCLLVHPILPIPISDWETHGEGLHLCELVSE